VCVYYDTAKRLRRKIKKINLEIKSDFNKIFAAEDKFIACVELLHHRTGNFMRWI